MSNRVDSEWTVFKSSSSTAVSDPLRPVQHTLIGVKRCAQISPSTEQLKVALTWNRVDIARSELFTGDIQWKVRIVGNDANSCDLTFSFFFCSLYATLKKA